MVNAVVMNVVNHITSKFFENSDAAFAKFAGVGSSTVWRWKDLNSIRQEHQRRILKKSDEENTGITPEDFFPERLGASE